MTDPKIIDKIKKCFALAASPVPGEAAAAISKARQLMDKYKIQQKDIDMSRVEQTYRKTERNSPLSWETMLSNIVGGAFGCKCIYVEHRINGSYRLCVNFIGLEPNAEIAAYCYSILHRKLKAARNEYALGLKRYKKFSKIKALQSYSAGWVGAVSTAIQRLIPETEVPAIVLDYFQEKYPEVITKDIGVNTKPNKHLINGHLDSRQVDINHGVDQPSTGLTLQ